MADAGRGLEMFEVVGAPAPPYTQKGRDRGRELVENCPAIQGELVRARGEKPELLRVRERGNYYGRVLSVVLRFPPTYSLFPMLHSVCVCVCARARAWVHSSPSLPLRIAAFIDMSQCTQSQRHCIYLIC
jgi:hypothetical protein